MLSEQIQAKINRELKKYPADQKQSAVMAALRFVQDEKGWIAADDMADIAVYLGMPKMVTYEGASLLPMLKPHPNNKKIFRVLLNFWGGGGGVSCPLGGQDPRVPPHQRSTSPKTMSCVPRMVTTSAIMWPRTISSSAAIWAKPGARIFMR